MDASENRYYGKDCPKGMVQVEFVGCDPDNRISEYSWKPEEFAFLELYVDGQRFTIHMGAIEGENGRRGMQIFLPFGSKVQHRTVNTVELMLPVTPEPEEGARVLICEECGECCCGVYDQPGMICTPIPCMHDHEYHADCGGRWIVQK